DADQPHAVPVVLAVQRRETILHGLDVRTVVADEHDRQDRRVTNVVACDGAAVDRGQVEVRARRPERDVAILRERHAARRSPLACSRQGAVARRESCYAGSATWSQRDATRPTIPMDVIVDLRAVRPARLASTLADEPLAGEARELRPCLRGARAEDLPQGGRLLFELGPT